MDAVPLETVMGEVGVSEETEMTSWSKRGWAFFPADFALCASRAVLIVATTGESFGGEDDKALEVEKLPLGLLVKKSVILWFSEGAFFAGLLIVQDGDGALRVWRRGNN